MFVQKTHLPDSKNNKTHFQLEKAEDSKKNNNYTFVRLQSGTNKKTTSWHTSKELDNSLSTI